MLVDHSHPESFVAVLPAGLTDSNIQKEKSHFKEAVKQPGTQLVDAMSFCAAAEAGTAQEGAAGGADRVRRVIGVMTRENQPAEHSAKLAGISRRYFFSYEFEGEVFSGMRACCFKGIGKGDYFSAAQVKKMLGFELEGFEAELLKGLDSSVARATTEPNAQARVIKSAGRKQADLAGKTQRREAREAKKLAARDAEQQHFREEEQRNADLGMFQCKACKSWLHQYSRERHAEFCSVRQNAGLASRAKLKPVEDLIQAAVHPSQRQELVQGELVAFFPAKFHSNVDPTRAIGSYGSAASKPSWGYRTQPTAKRYSEHVKTFLRDCFDHKPRMASENIHMRMVETFTERSSPQPCILDSQPSTLNSQPSTLNSQPSPPNPKP